MKATFFKRLLAYLVDIVLISLMVTLLTIGFKNTASDNIQEELTNLTTEYTSGEIEITELFEKYMPKIYEYQKATMSTNIIYLMVIIAYFIVFQYLNKGQTIGKKLLGIRIVNSEDNESPSLKTMIVRNILINEILLNMFSIILLFILKEKMYFYVYEALTIIVQLFVYACAVCILYSKNKLGFHDMIAKTKVINERG